jgi:hypothetical protein
MALGDGITADLYIELGSILKILCIRSLEVAILAPGVYFRRESRGATAQNSAAPKQQRSMSLIQSGAVFAL